LHPNILRLTNILATLETTSIKSSVCQHPFGDFRDAP